MNADRELVERRDESFYIAGSRVPLACIVREFQGGQSPETIRSAFPTLTLEQVYGAITFYLGHRTEVDTDLAAREREEDAFGETHPAPVDLREKLPLPIACTLSPAALKARREDLLGGLVRRADEHVELANGYRVRFKPDDGVLTTIASVVDVERQCCPFLNFDISVEPDDGAIWLEFTGPPGTKEFLASMLDP